MDQQIVNALVDAEPKLILGANNVWTNGVGDMHPTAPTTFAHFSLNGSLVVSGSEDRTIRVWSATESNGTSTGILSVLEHPSVVLGGTFLSNEAYVVCYDQDGSLVLWDWSQANICDRDAAAHEQHGDFRQLFPAGTHRPLGFFSTHQGESYRWQICYWEVIQENDREVREPHSTGDNPTNNRLRLVAEGTLPRTGGYGVTRVHHKPSESSNPSISSVIVEFRDGQQSSASMIDPTNPTARTTPQTLSFHSVSKRAEQPTRAKDLYIGSERPCLQSNDGAWIMDEHDCRILWVPPMHRGWGRWRETKLLLEGTSGRITLMDFSHVDLHSSDPF